MHTAPLRDKIEYCSELYQNTVYVHLHQAMKRGIKPCHSCKSVTRRFAGKSVFAPLDWHRALDLPTIVLPVELFSLSVRYVSDKIRYFDLWEFLEQVF